MKLGEHLLSKLKTMLLGIQPYRGHSAPLLQMIVMNPKGGKKWGEKPPTKSYNLDFQFVALKNLTQTKTNKVLVY